MRTRTLVRGFTLIELLLVVAIIGILAAIVGGSLMFSRQKARDARRIADLKAIATALELHRNDTGHYPVATGWVSGCDRPGAHWIPDGSDYGWAAAHFSETPRDPRETCGGGDAPLRSYAYQSDGREYRLTAALEGGAAPDGDPQVYAFDGTSFQAMTDAPLTVAISSPYTSPTGQSPIPVTVAFSRAVVNFTQASLSIVRGVVSGFSQTLATVWQVLITPTDNDTIVVSLSGGAVHDAQGVGNEAAQFVISFDSLHPHPALSPDPLPAQVGGPFSVHVNFTLAVTDFSPSKVSVQNGLISNFQMVPPGTNRNFTFIVTPAGLGTVTLFIPQNAVQSQAGNGNVQSNTLTTTFNP